MIYSTQALFSQYEKPRIFSEDTSLFLEGLELLQKSNFALNELMLSYHRDAALKEAYLCESFNIAEIIENVIKWFCDIINEIFGKFKALMFKITATDRSFQKYEKRFKEFNGGDMKIDFQRYFYTCSDPEIPKCGLADQFDKELEDLRKRLTKMASCKTKPERIHMMGEILSDLKNDTDPSYYAMVRSSCLGLNYPISQDSFPTELFNIFRNGGEYYSERVDNREVMEAYERFRDHKTLIKKAETQKTAIVNSANEVKKQIKAITLKSISSSYVPYDIGEEQAFDDIIKRKVGQISEVCNIYVLAFTAKLDALKEAYAQDRKFLLAVISYMEEHPND